MNDLKDVLQEFPVGIFEVKFLIETDEDDETFVDLTTIHMVAGSIDQCLRLATGLKSIDGEKVLRVEGIEMIADHLFLPKELNLINGRVAGA